MDPPRHYLRCHEVRTLIQPTSFRHLGTEYRTYLPLWSPDPSLRFTTTAHRIEPRGCINRGWASVMTIIDQDKHGLGA